MSDLMREEFEQAVLSMHVSNGVPAEDAAAFLEIGSNGYRSVSTKSAWWAWQASRECLAIELPDRFDEHYQDYYEDVDGGCFNEGRYINDVHAALTAAGVKYK